MENRIHTTITTNIFFENLPILYVLYGENSHVLKVGKTKDSAKRLSHYNKSRGKNNSHFRRGENIQVLAYYKMPNFNYSLNICNRILTTCENLLVSNAKDLLGQPIHGNEWFLLDDVKNFDVKRLFAGVTQHIVETIENIDDKQHLTAKPNYGNRKSDSVQQFADYCVDNELLGSHVSLNQYYLMYGEWCRRFNKSAKPVVQTVFSKRFKEILTKTLDYQSITQRYKFAQLSHLQCPIHAMYELFPELKSIESGRSHILVSENKIIKQEDVDSFKKLNTIETIDSESLGFKHYMILSHIAYDTPFDDLSTMAQSLLES